VIGILIGHKKTSPQLIIFLLSNFCQDDLAKEKVKSLEKSFRFFLYMSRHKMRLESINKEGMKNMGVHYTLREKGIGKWKYDNFTLLLSAGLLLSIGNKIYELLLPLLMYQLSESSIIMTQMRTAELLPNLFFGMFIGVIVDRVNQKKWAMAMVLFQALILFVMYEMFGRDIYKPILYYLLGFMLMTLNYGYFNVQISLVKMSLPMNKLTSANAKLSFVETFVGIMGPVLLSMVLILSNMEQGLLIAAFLYAVSYILLMRLKVNEPEKNNLQTSFWADFKAGWREFSQNKALKSMTFFIMVANCSMTVVSTTVLFFGTEELKLSNSMLSFLLSSAGVGGLLGSLAARSLRDRYSLGILFGMSILLNGVAYLGLFFTHHWLLLVPSLLLNGFASCVYTICAYTFRQEQTPAALMGRISGITGTLFRFGMPVAMLLSGWMMDVLGSSSVFISACLLNIMLFLLYKKSNLWQLP
jgi:MFS family permease